MPSFAPGNRSRTASAITCAVLWRMASMRRVGAGIEELVGGSARGRLELGLVVFGLLARLRLLVDHVTAPENQQNLPSDRTRGPTSRGSTRLHGRIACRDAVVRSSRANGRIPGRFSGRSRVVPSSVVSVGACSRWPRLSGDVPMGRVPLDALGLAGPRRA